MDWDARKAEICGPASLAMIPWNDDFSPDLGALEDNIRWMVDGGLVTGRGFVISPSGTGELALILHGLGGVGGLGGLGRAGTRTIWRLGA